MKIFINILFLIFFVTQTYANKKDSLYFDYDFINYTLDDGLPSNETYSTLQDDEGYLWISTDNGVSRFNGYEFENFTIEDGLIDNTIFNMFKDEKGRIWMPGYNGKLCYWENGEFVHYKYNYVIDSLREFDYPSSHNISQIDINNNVLLINYAKGGLKFDENTFKSEVFQFYPKNLSHNLNFEYVNNKNFIISSGHIHKQINLKKGNEIVLTENTNSELIRAYSTIFNDTTFIIFNKSIFKLFENELIEIIKLDEVFISFMIEKKTGRFWLISEKGGIYLTKNFTQTFPIIKDIRFSSAFEDNNGGVWLNSLTQGLFYLKNQNVKLLHNDNNLTKGVFDVYFNFKDTLLFYNKEINLLCKVESDLIKKENERTIHIDKLINPNINNKVVLNNFDFRVDNRKIITALRYGAFFKNKLYVHSGAGVTLPDKVQSLPNKTSGKCIIGFQNKLYIGKENGLFLFNDKKVLRDTRVSGDYNIQSFSNFNEGLVIGTKGKGFLILFSDSIIKFSEENGLLSNSVNCFFNESNKLWIGTNEGINSLTYDKIKGEYILENELTKFEGLYNPKINQLVVKNGLVYIGTDNGLIMYDYLKKDREPISNKHILIKYFKVNNEIVNIHKSVFDYDKNNINIQFEAVSFKNEGEIKYRYKVSNLIDEWQEIDKREVSFFKLSPNKYQFEIQYQMPSLEWSESTLLNFEIQNPYWKTWWFGLILVIILAFIIWFLINDYNKRKQREFDFYKSSQVALRSQMNPHFVFNALNSLQNYMLKNENKLAHKYLIKFSRLIRIVFENSKKSFIELDRDIEALRMYVELEQKRFEEKFTFEIENNIDKKVLIPPLIIQPVVENAIWHGLMPSDRKGKLKVLIQIINNKLQVQISDNGIGIEKSKSMKSESIFKSKTSSGIANTKERISLLALQYKLDLKFEISELDINEAQVGTLVIFELPLFEKDPTL